MSFNDEHSSDAVYIPGAIIPLSKVCVGAAISDMQYTQAFVDTLTHHQYHAYQQIWDIADPSPGAKSLIGT